MESRWQRKSGGRREKFKKGRGKKKVSRRAVKLYAEQGGNLSSRKEELAELLAQRRRASGKVN